MAEKKLNPKEFNSDPKYQEQRETLDEMVEQSILRIGKKRAPESSETQTFGEMLDSIFGGGK